jgi:hypothetical protein
MATILDPYQPDDQQYVYDYTVELDSATYRVELVWKTRQLGWYLSLYAVDETALLLGKRLSADTPLLRRYQIDGLPPGDLVCIDMEDLGAEPTFESLGKRHLLWYFDESELPAQAVSEDLLIEIA